MIPMKVIKKKNAAVIFNQMCFAILIIVSVTAMLILSMEHIMFDDNVAVLCLQAPLNMNRRKMQPE